MGPPGSNRRDTALALGVYFGWEGISVRDILKNEITKKSEYGKAISENIKNYRYGNLIS